MTKLRDQAKALQKSLKTAAAEGKDALKTIVGDARGVATRASKDVKEMIRESKHRAESTEARAEVDPAVTDYGDSTKRSSVEPSPDG